MKRWVPHARSVASLMVLLLVATVDAGQWKMYQQTASFMGSKWQIILYSRSPAPANIAIERGFKVIGEIEHALTNYGRDSELNRLCRSAPHVQPVPVSDHLWRVLREADGLSRLTNGAFDVTVGPLTKLWRRSRAKQRLPSSIKLALAKKSVGFKLIEFVDERQAVRLTASGMQIDLGGIAKGYAVDQAMAEIRKCNITSALVNGGGDLAVSNSPPGADGWEIDVSVLEPSESPNRIRLTNAAIATSGDAWQFLEIDGVRYSHIVDPTTGVGLTRRVSVSVIAPHCMQADSWASALCVLSTESMHHVIQQTPLAAMITIIDNDKPNRHYVNGFPQREPN